MNFCIAAFFICIDVVIIYSVILLYCIGVSIFCINPYCLPGYSCCLGVSAPSPSSHLDAGLFGLGRAQLDHAFASHVSAFHLLV